MITHNIRDNMTFLLDRMAHFLRQLRHSSRSRALAHSLLSFLASSKLHPFCGKKQGEIRMLKFTQIFSPECRPFIVSIVIAVGHVRWHAPSFHSLLSRNCIHSAAKSSVKYECLSLPKNSRQNVALSSSAPFRLKKFSNQYPANSRKTL